MVNDTRVSTIICDANDATWKALQHVVQLSKYEYSERDPLNEDDPSDKFILANIRQLIQLRDMLDKLKSAIYCYDKVQLTVTDAENRSTTVTLDT